MEASCFAERRLLQSFITRALAYKLQLMMHLSLQVPHARFLEFTFGVFVFLFFTLLCQEVTSSFFMFLRKCDQMTKISICFYLGRISLRYLIPVYVRFFFF